jgi:endogenous inhibitor of DNA gyrase (YacG/DUF329 family)
MTVPTTKWRPDDPCPWCGTALTATDEAKAITVDCPLCGWSDTWTGDHGTEVIV